MIYKSSRRWNKVVRNLLHSLVFEPKKTVDVDENKLLTSPSLSTLNVALKEEAPIKKRSTKKSTKKTTTTITTTTTTASTTTTTATTTTTTTRVTRAAAAAAAKAKSKEAEADEIKIQAGINTESTDEEEHEIIVTHNGSTKRLPKKSFWITRQGKGLLSFIVSGIFHELIIMSACRHITLENLIFFILQGAAVMIEVELRQGNLKQEPKGIIRVVCVALQLIFMSITGRLFTGPFLRYQFFPENLSV